MNHNYTPPPRKFHPSGLTILYEDNSIIVVNKIEGLLTIGTDAEKKKTAHHLLGEYVKKGNHRSNARVYVVHRLDRDTSGVIVFAKDEKSKQFLQSNWSDFNKKYIAVVEGHFENKQGFYESYLAENKAFQVYSTKETKEGKYAKTGYQVLNANNKYSIVSIDLFTGRKHQIRVHLSENGHPIVGDKIYGKHMKGIKRLALHSSFLSIKHPVTNQQMDFQTEMPIYFNSLVKPKV